MYSTKANSTTPINRILCEDVQVQVENCNRNRKKTQKKSTRRIQEKMNKWNDRTLVVGIETNSERNEKQSKKQIGGKYLK